jgi:hypothetical protein
LSISFGGRTNSFIGSYVVVFDPRFSRRETHMSDIERRQLGRTGLSVTALGFGAMDLGGPPAANEISDDEAGRVLNAVLDSASISSIRRFATALAKPASAAPFHTGARNSS